MLKNNPIDVIKPIIDSLSFTPPPHDKNDIFQVRSIIKAYDDHTFHIHPESTLFPYLRGLKNLKVSSKADSDFVINDYNWYMNELLQIYRKGNTFASSARRFIQSYISGLDINRTMIGSMVKTFKDNISDVENTKQVLIIVSELIRYYHDKTLKENKTISSIIDAITEVLCLYLCNDADEKLLDFVATNSMWVVEDIPHKIDEYSITLILLLSDISSKTYSYDDIIRILNKSLKRVKSNGNANLFLSGVYDNPLIGTSKAVTESLRKEANNGFLDIKEKALSMGIRQIDGREFIRVLDMSTVDGFQSLIALEGKLNPDAPKRFGTTHIMTGRDRLIINEGLRNKYNLIEGTDINDSPAIYAQNDDGVMLVTKDIGSESEYRLLKIVDFMDDTMYRGFINPKILDNRKIISKKVRLKDKDTVTIAESLINISKDGDIEFVRNTRGSLMDEFNQSNRLVNLYIKQNEYESLKPVLVDLFALINYIEVNHMNKKETIMRNSRKKKAEAVRARMYTISTFNRAYSFVMDNENDFDLSKYLIENQTKNVSHKLSYDNLLGIRKIVLGLVSGT